MTKPKILFLDIETSLATAAVFSLFPDRISHKNLLSESFIICASYKFAGDKKTQAIKISAKDAKKGNDKAVVKKLHALIKTADVLVGHNLDKFDTKIIKGRCLKYGLEPLTFLRSVDTLKVARRHFKLMSNRLDYIGTFLNLGNKINTSASLWLDVLAGKQKAIDEMSIYCNQDVDLLEAVFNKLLPYVENFPTIPHEGGDIKCPACKSSKTRKYGFVFSNKHKCQKRQCMDCGSTFKGEKL